MKFYIETYGCQMNVSDSELITSILLEAGHSHAADIDSCDVLFFNTCSVRKHAEDRVLGRISNEKKRKSTNQGFRIAVVGCMAQRMGEELIKKGIGVDYVFGVDQYQRIPEILGTETSSQYVTDFDPHQVYPDLMPTHNSTTCGFVTIMRGCNNFCTYCIVPYVRGRERSRPLAEIIEEVRLASSKGLHDITLLGQNVNSYTYDGMDFATLLGKLANVDEVYRLRFITSHPKDLSDSLIDVMASHRNISKHIHLPLQSGDNKILKAMNRYYDIEHYLKLISKLRNAMPDIAITTDLIAGFPGETEAEFMNTLQVMDDVQFDYAFCFKYSNREGTTAAEYTNQIPEPERLRRLQEMIDRQRAITHNKFCSKIGKEVEIYAEDISKKNPNQLSGKTDDYKIAVISGSPDQIGTLIRGKVIAATPGTLICE